jgi:DNA-binding PadR family transcriptional regulator
MFMLTVSISKHNVAILASRFLHKLNKSKHEKFMTKPAAEGKMMAETDRREIVLRIARNLLDVQLLRLIQAEPQWGYRIKKEVETKFDIRLRHGVLYPMLNSLERKGFLTSQEQHQGGRARKVYTITERGREYLQSYYAVLKEQMEGKDHK